MNIQKINIKSMGRDELQAELLDRGLKKFRAGQVLTWIYTHYAPSFEEMTNIPKAERGLLSSVFYISTPNIVRTELSKDCTRKFLFALEDAHTIESVLIPDEDRQTLCISSQVGCQQACRFCLTGSGGFTRNLNGLRDRRPGAGNIAHPAGGGKTAHHEHRADGHGRAAGEL